MVRHNEVPTSQTSCFISCTKKNKGNKKLRHFLTSFLDAVIVVVVDVAFNYSNTTVQIKADCNKMEIFHEENCVTK